MAEKWTKTSGEPSSGVMKPYPLVELNHLTVPSGTVLPRFSTHDLSLAGDLSVSQQWQTTCVIRRMPTRSIPDREAPGDRRGAGPERPRATPGGGAWRRTPGTTERRLREPRWALPVVASVGPPPGAA